MHLAFEEVFVNDDGQIWRMITSDAAKTVGRADLGTIVPVSCVASEEPAISSIEQLKRLGEKEVVPIGVRSFFDLWQEEGHDTLESIYQKGLHKGLYSSGYAVFFDVLGTLLESPMKGNPQQYLLYFSRDPLGKWNYGYRWLTEWVPGGTVYYPLVIPLPQPAV